MPGRHLRSHCGGGPCCRGAHLTKKKPKKRHRRHRPPTESPHHSPERPPTPPQESQQPPSSPGSPPPPASPVRTRSPTPPSRGPRPHRRGGERWEIVGESGGGNNGTVPPLRLRLVGAANASPYIRYPGPFPPLGPIPPKYKGRNAFFRRHLGPGYRQPGLSFWKYYVLFWGTDPRALYKLARALQIQDVCRSTGVQRLPGSNNGNYNITVYCAKKKTPKKIKKIQRLYEHCYPTTGHFNCSLGSCRPGIPVDQ
ncbi:unknown [Bovine gammaherpesvirus 4]|uniref:ORF73 n=2 Tax=Bovine herpesvirus 4 TaxID=10385 RepID=Q1XBR2_BHV4|nr:unknown [Bovine gammaherpesvirus 4]AAK07994.1 unknown [Bovine gammaherpesvirus 4]AAY21857.1 ORF73 [Bovine gammaherpesvirus 4]QJC19120.1 hypothetical protein [Bovine gammaherpesvirus 4]